MRGSTRTADRTGRLDAFTLTYDFSDGSDQSKAAFEKFLIDASGTGDASELLIRWVFADTREADRAAFAANTLESDNGSLHPEGATPLYWSGQTAVWLGDSPAGWFAKLRTSGLTKRLDTDNRYKRRYTVPLAYGGIGDATFGTSTNILPAYMLAFFERGLTVHSGNDQSISTGPGVVTGDTTTLHCYFFSFDDGSSSDGLYFDSLKHELTCEFLTR